MLAKTAKQCQCGGTIVCDDAAKTIRHSEPSCSAFDAIMHAVGMRPFRDPWVEVINLDGTVAKPGSA